MDIVQEELKPKNGPSGSKFGTVVDKDTNEPIAKYTKQQYGKKYDVEWHPTFLALNPGVSKSYEALDIKSQSPDSLDGVTGHVTRLHTRLAEQGFKDKFVVKRTTDPENKNKVTLDYHDNDGNHIASRHINRDEYGAAAHIVKLSPDFISKHNVSPEVADSVNKQLGAQGSTHIGFVDRLSHHISELSKKKTATGLHAFGDATVGVYHIDTSPEEASSAHEAQFAGTHTVNRLSPTHFVATSNSGDQMVHSTVVGNQLHQIKTNIGGYSAKKLSFNHSF